jgi:hypothetical protein
MASRQYSVPYNPQDWGPVGVNASQAAAYSQQATVHHAAPQQRLHGGWWPHFRKLQKSNTLMKYP